VADRKDHEETEEQTVGRADKAQDDPVIRRLVVLVPPAVDGTANAMAEAITPQRIRSRTITASRAYFFPI
jgi:hypothetical protein